ncbi:heavy metal-binding domain-containing protein [uncultured Intestinimonas sp.]|uniref:YbjQ family protein n=1 Tax=uncultured Intestinimonas sp. TaxID=1689265 RepID=UPI0025EFB748|nr:heavy metal-binding domain-containing protein [uncultured Intestinimonas sp.]
MVLTTTERISGLEIETLGLVQGSAVQGPGPAEDGEEVHDWAGRLNEARSLATRRMVKEAESLGADAVVCVRYSTALLTQGDAEVLAYGTAVKFL